MLLSKADLAARPRRLQGFYTTKLLLLGSQIKGQTVTFFLPIETATATCIFSLQFFLAFLPNSLQCFLAFLSNSLQCFLAFLPNSLQCFLTFLPNSLQCFLAFLPNSITRISFLLLFFFLKVYLGYIPLTYETVHNTWHTIILLKTMPNYFKHETNRGWELKYKQSVVSYIYICCFPWFILKRMAIFVFREHRRIFEEDERINLKRGCVGAVKIPSRGLL